MSTNGTTPRLPSPIADVMKAEFDVWLLTTLLFGAYTAVYFCTLYLYTMYKKSPRSWIIIVSITVAYLTSAVMVGIGWFSAKMGYIGLVQALEDGRFPNVKGPSFLFLTLLNDLCILAVSAVADGLLMWRCYNVWDGSFRSIFLQLILVFIEIGTYLSAVVIQVTSFSSPSARKSHIFGILLGTSYFLTFATTMVNTVAIAYRIYSFTKHDLRTGSKAKLNQITLILVESAAAYSMVTLAVAIVLVIPVTPSNGAAMSTANSLLSPTYLFVAGIAPTVMAARVFLASGLTTSTVSELSTLRFRSAVFQITQSERGSGFQAPETMKSRFLLVPSELEGKNDPGSILHIA